MGSLEISLLGSYQIVLDGAPVTAIETQKGWALLAYLAVESDRAHSRSALAALLWPAYPERAARRSVSQALYNLRRVLEEEAAPSPFLLATRRDIRFNPASDHRLDVRTFRALLDGIHTHEHSTLEACDPCLERLQRAVKVYRGDFLAGFSLPGGEAFDEWRLSRQEALHQQAMGASTRLAKAYERRRDYERAAHSLQRLISLEPWREEAHRQLMAILARTGQRAAAVAQFERCRQVLHNEFGVSPTGETMAVLAAIQEGGEEPAANPSPLQPAAHNLPAPATPFFGRQAELARLEDLIRDPDYRFITLVGAGGVGKTRLALEVAGRTRAGFPHGTWFVPLVGLPAGSPEQIAGSLIAALANTLGFAFSGPRGPKEQLFAYLGARQSLLVLDNFEHLLDGAGLVTELLQQAPGLAIVCTSREPLHCQAEYVLAVEGLPVPSLDGEGGALDTWDSVQLFVERADRTPQRFVLSDDNAPAVAQVCRLVDGNPLGLELAAAKVHRQALPEVVGSIQTNLDFLATRMRDVPARHRSMRAVFDASWQSLLPKEQRVLAQLSVFRGGFTPQAALAVVGAADGVLSALGDKSLLGGPVGGRYELHELVRQYAAEKLLENGEWRMEVGGQASNLQPPTSNLQDRHSTYFLQFVADQEAAIRGPKPQPALAALRGDLDNVRQAWQQAVSDGQAERIYRGVPGLMRYYQLSSLFVPGVELFEEAAEVLRAIVQAAPAPAPEAGRALCRVLNGQGLLLRFAEEYERMQGCAREAVGLAQQVSDLYEEAYGCWLLSVSNKLRGGIEAADRHARQALALARAGRFRRLEARSLSLLADVQLGLGRWTPAERLSHHQQALAILEEVGDLYWQAEVLNLLAGMHYRQHHYTQALTHWREALSGFRQLGNRSSQRKVLFNMGAACEMLGQYAEALAHHEQSWQISQDLGMAHLPLPLIGLCRTHVCQGQYSQASKIGERAVVLSRRLDNALYETQACIALGHTQAVQGSMDQAGACYRTALAQAGASGDRFLAADARAGLACVALAQGDVAEASSWVGSLLQMEEEGSLVSCEEWAANYLACYRVLQAGGDPRARGILNRAHAHVQAAAAQIEDEVLRRSFLENVAAHREIVAEWDRICANGLVLAVAEDDG